MVKEEIFQKSKKIIADVLVLDSEDEVKIDSVLSDDLGAESIDYVELIYGLSKEFGIDFERKDIYPDRMVLSDKKYVNGAALTDEGVSFIERKWPHIPDEILLNSKRDNAGLVKYLQSVEILIDFLFYKTNQVESSFK